LLITRRNGKIAIHGNSGKVLQLTNEFELINQDIFDGFMLNKALLNGEGPSYANAQVGLLSMGQRLNKLRGEIAHWIEENLFKPVAEWNGFEIDNKRGGTKLIYPTVKWDDLQLKDNTNLLQIAMQARTAGDLSAQTMLDLMDINYDQEVERLRMENSFSASTSPMLSSGEMGNGYRGPVGGGMPPMGGGMPPMDMGMGAPPAGPPMGGMPPAPMASNNTPEDNYRNSVAISNAIQENVRTGFYNGLKTTYANKYRSAAHQEFIESQCPVDGTGFRGALNSELSPMVSVLEEFGPYHGGESSVPMNPVAIQERQSDIANEWIRISKKDKDEMRKGPYERFTSWENRLYEIVLGLNPPLPFYAQYPAGPEEQYRLDGAFPDIQLGVEADSETYHASVEYIERDRYRDSQLATQGWTLLRFTENELKERQDEVQSLIMRTIQQLIKRKMGG
jgi:very-short-patch-repair endonuclease